MERPRPVLWGFGLAGVAAGVLGMLVGSYGGELSGFLAGYGLLVVLSSAYLLIGLALQRWIVRRGRPTSQPIPQLTHR
jgi:hypothetical protein